MLVFHVKLGSERHAQSTGAGWGAGGDMLLEPWALRKGPAPWLWEQPPQPVALS